MLRNDSRPFFCSASMMLWSIRSSPPAGPTAPRLWSLRNARQFSPITLHRVNRQPFPLEIGYAIVDGSHCNRPGGGMARTPLMRRLQKLAREHQAADRLGGRMHSDWTEFGHAFWANGQQAELCGELIDSNHKTILQLAQRFGLPTVDLIGAQPNGTEDTYYIFRAPYPKNQADQDFQPVHNTLQGQVQATSYPTLYNLFTAAGKFFDNMTVYDWIENYVPGGHSSQFGALLDNAYNEEYGAETTNQAALNLIYLLGYNTKPGNFSIYGKSDERYHIAGGNTLVPLAVANALPAESIHLNNRMTSIKTNSDGTIT